MKRHELEHLLRAAGAITGENRIAVIGSQAILALEREIPEELVVSVEADLYPMDNPGKADLIDGTIGELSPFHETFRYFAHGVGPATAVLPENWLARALRISNENTRGVEGICPAPADLAVSKLAAGRSKDIAFVEVMIARGIVVALAVASAAAELAPAEREAVLARLMRIGKGSPKKS